MGFYTLESLQTFAARHALSDEYFYRRETYQERPWFVLIHSLHDTRQAAEARVAKLSPELAKLKIWIRQLDSSKPVLKVRPDSD
ncbi:hypothetical protein CKO27_11565 [Thiocystis violacea]|nr:hypothetical protein [Thiocystis violacea]